MRMYSRYVCDIISKGRFVCTVMQVQTYIHTVYTVFEKVIYSSGQP
jgi:hypothetical protein